MLLEVIDKYCQGKNVPFESAVAVVCYESYAVKGVKSHAGALGYAQVKPIVAKEVILHLKH